MEKILIIGAGGQIGTELTDALRKKFGNDNVVASDIKNFEDSHLTHPYEKLDVTDKDGIERVIDKYGITQLYNLAALLSATAESKPKLAWDINMIGLFNTLDLAVEKKLTKVFWPSSIAVFGPDTPRQNTPQNTIMQPNTVYGISKLAGEGWCSYYNKKHGLDVRSIRYPGLISYKSEPGGGTTDYAVDIFYEAIKHGRYTSFLSKDTELPMMFMEDAIRGTIELMDAPVENISVRAGYNFAAFSFTPEVLAEEIKKSIPEFDISYDPDFRQEIANGWPASIDDSVAQKDWSWKPVYDLSKMTKVMLEEVGKKLETTV